MSKVITAKQFSSIYDEKEDRIRLIINLNYPDRYDLWITRKFLIDIMDNVQTYLMNFKAEEKQTNNNNYHQQELPIYESTNTPLILETFNITKRENNFILILKDSNITIQAILTLNELKNFLKLILNPVKIKWGIWF